jgi:hypothetical protein
LTLKYARLRRMINKAKMDEWPGGEAWKMRESMVKKYRPDNRQLRHAAVSMM